MGEGDGPLELLGTAGCHLCEQAEPLARSAANYLAMRCVMVDIAPDAGLVDDYGTRIPVLRYRASSGETRELEWPFGVLDILRLVRPEAS